MASLLCLHLALQHLQKAFQVVAGVSRLAVPRHLHLLRQILQEDRREESSVRGQRLAEAVQTADVDLRLSVEGPQADGIGLLLYSFQPLQGQHVLRRDQVRPTVSLFKLLHCGRVVGFGYSVALDGFGRFASQVLNEVPQLLVSRQIRVAVDGPKAAPKAEPFGRLARERRYRQIWIPGSASGGLRRAGPGRRC